MEKNKKNTNKRIDFFVMMGFGFELLLFIGAGYYSDHSIIMSLICFLLGLVFAYETGKLIRVSNPQGTTTNLTQPKHLNSSGSSIYHGKKNL